MKPFLNFIFLYSLLLPSLIDLCLSSPPNTIRYVAQEGRHMVEGGNCFKTSEMFPRSSNTEREAMYAQQSARPSSLNQGPQSLGSPVFDDTRRRNHRTAYREAKGQKTSNTYPETKNQNRSHRIPSKASYNDNHLACHVFGNLQNMNQPEYHPVNEYENHIPSPNFINPQDLLTNGVPVVCLPKPDFVLPGIVPCFLKAEDAVQWAASGAELYHPDSTLTSATIPLAFFGDGTPDLVVNDGQRVWTQGSLNRFETIHSNPHVTPQKTTHRQKDIFTGPPQAVIQGPEKKRVKTSLLPNHKVFNCFKHSIQRSTPVINQQDKPTESAFGVSKLEVDKDTLPKVKIQLQEEIKMSQKEKVNQQHEQPFAQRIQETQKSRENSGFMENLGASSQIRIKDVKTKQIASQGTIKSNHKQDPCQHNPKDIAINTSYSGSVMSDTKQDELKIGKGSYVPTKSLLRPSVINSESSKAFESTKNQKSTQYSAEKKITNPKEKTPTSQDMISFQEKEIQPKHEDRDITGELPEKGQLDQINWEDSTYKDAPETEHRKCKTADIFSSSLKSPLISKSVMDAEDLIPEESDHGGWIICHGRRLHGKKTWHNMKKEASRFTPGYKESNAMEGVKSTQPVSNRPVDTLSTHNNHQDECRIPNIIGEKISANKLPEEIKYGINLDTDLTTPGGIIDHKNRKLNSNLIFKLHSKPIPQKNHQIDRRPKGNSSLDMVGSEPQSPGTKETSESGEKFLDIDDDDNLKPSTVNEDIASPDVMGDIEPNSAESSAVEEYGSLNSVNKYNAEIKKSKKKQKKKGKLNKSKALNESEEPLPQSIVQIMKTHVGKAILDTLQFQNKKRLLPINMDKKCTFILADDCLNYTLEGEFDPEKRLAWVKTFDEFSLKFGDKCEAQRRVAALLVQFSQKANQIYFKHMKNFISEPLLEVLKILKVEEEFPLFQDFDSAKFSNFQRLKSELSEADHLILLYMCSEEELNNRIHQMSIMARIDHNSILFNSNEMKDFIKQGGSLQSVLEIQHNLGFGIKESIWKEMDEYKIKERALNIIYAMLGVSVLQDNPKLLWSVSQQWFESYTREFFFQWPQLSHIFEERFGMLVEYSEKLPLTNFSDWMNEDEALEMGTIAQHQLQWGKVLVGVHCGIPLIYLWNGLVLIYDKVDLKYRPGIKDKRPLYWPLNLPPNMDNCFERFKKFFEFFGKRLFLTNKF